MRLGTNESAEVRHGERTKSTNARTACLARCSLRSLLSARLSLASSRVRFFSPPPPRPVAHDREFCRAMLMDRTPRTGATAMQSPSREYARLLHSSSQCPNIIAQNKKLSPSLPNRRGRWRSGVTLCFSSPRSSFSAPRLACRRAHRRCCRAALRRSMQGDACKAKEEDDGDMVRRKSRNERERDERRGRRGVTLGTTGTERGVLEERPCEKYNTRQRRGCTVGRFSI